MLRGLILYKGVYSRLNGKFRVGLLILNFVLKKRLGRDDWSVVTHHRLRICLCWPASLIRRSNAILGLYFSKAETEAIILFGDNSWNRSTNPAAHPTIRAGLNEGPSTIGTCPRKRLPLCRISECTASTIFNGGTHDFRGRCLISECSHLLLRS